MYTMYRKFVVGKNFIHTKTNAFYSEKRFTMTESSAKLPSARMNGPLVQIGMAIGLTIWLKRIVLNSLRITVIEMAHLDPTEIIGRAYPVDVLSLFVGGATTALFLLSVPWWDFIILVKQLFQFILTTILLWLFFILSGANPLQNYVQTGLASLYIASLLCWNPGQPLISFLDCKEPISRQFLTIKRYATIITMVPCSILHILDWGAQIQRWPIPLLIGSTIGLLIGTLLEVARDIMTRKLGPTVKPISKAT